MAPPTAACGSNRAPARPAGGQRQPPSSSSSSSSSRSAPPTRVIRVQQCPAALAAAAALAPPAPAAPGAAPPGDRLTDSSSGSSRVHGVQPLWWPLQGGRLLQQRRQQRRQRERQRQQQQRGARPGWPRRGAACRRDSHSCQRTHLCRQAGSLLHQQLQVGWVSCVCAWWSACACVCGQHHCGCSLCGALR
jgi:hypothetical protein